MGGILGVGRGSEEGLVLSGKKIPLPSSALCLRPIVVLRFFIFFDISQNMIIFARFKSSSEAQLNFLRESPTLGYVRHYDLNRSCN